MAIDTEGTGAFDVGILQRGRCATCGGTGKLRIDSENINEDFEVEKQTSSPHAWTATGRAARPRGRIDPFFHPDSHPDKSEKGSIGYDTANYSARNGPLMAA